MDYKEKYNKLVEAIKVLQKANPSDEGIQNWVNDNVPELVESEDESEDEKIRKEIIAVFKGQIAFTSEEMGKRYIAWLEKQGTPAILSEEEQNRFAKGVLSSCAISFINYLDAHKYEGKMCVSNGECEDIENAFQNAMWDRLHRYYCKFIYKHVTDLIPKRGEQKPADKVEPKFKIGDWVVYNRDDYSREILQVYDIRDGRYYFTDNVHFSWSIKECDEKSHLWSIEDARDGDVLVCNNNPFLFSKYEKDEYGLVCCSYCGISGNGEFIVNSNAKKYWCDIEFVYPATKEQRDTLFAKIREAGYMWNAEKNVLSKCVIDEGKSEIDYCFTKMMNGEKINPTCR